MGGHNHLRLLDCSKSLQHTSSKDSSYIYRLHTRARLSRGQKGLRQDLPPPLLHHLHQHYETMSLHEANHTNFWNGTPWFIHECTIELDSNYRRIALFLIYLFIFMVGLLENALVIWVNWRRRHSANGVLFCIINMSLSDLMVIVIQPFFMMEVTMNEVWLWGRFLCKVTHLIYKINFYSSTFFLAFMTMERYLSLTRPSSPALFPVAGRRRWLLCGGLWVFSFFMALIENVHVDLLEWDEPGCYMMPEYNHIECVVQSLTLFHCIANPILYNFLSKSFRNNLINTVVTYIPRERAVDQPNSLNGGGTDLGKQRKLSDASTSQSDVAS
ncbi:G-protein coupled receptor 182 [Solea senegalensis]|uniref:G-protein coupled receptor 182 n=1 Tax=Solea senegalensis TaxID=28829 RepID=A0AAV6SPX2_SOLSE|nr:G-protein coupled receptor 182 [Solea senegalensis]